MDKIPLKYLTRKCCNKNLLNKDVLCDLLKPYCSSSVLQWLVLYGATLQQKPVLLSASAIP